MLIILLLVCISEFTFFMDAEDDFPDRLNTSITLILASVAFLYVASESLPKISYLTLLDKMMLFSFIMLFATALESFVSYILIVWADRPAAAYWVDIGSAIAYPALYLMYGLYLGTNAVAVRRKQKASEGGGGGGGGGGGATYSSTLPAVGGGDGDGDAGCCGALRPRRHRTPTLMMENAAPEAAPAKSVKQVSGVV